MARRGAGAARHGALPAGRPAAAAGRVEEAEALLADCVDDVVAARLRLSRGEPGAAVALLQRCPAHVAGATGTATVLLLLVEAQLATVGPDAAAKTVGQLTTLAAGQSAEYVAALASTAGNAPPGVSMA